MTMNQNNAINGNGTPGLKGEGATVMKTSLDHTKQAALQAAFASVQAAVQRRLGLLGPAHDFASLMSTFKSRGTLFPLGSGARRRSLMGLIPSKAGDH